MTIDQFRTKIREINGTTTSDYSDASLIRDLNAEASMVQIHILRDRGVLEFDDTNFTDIPVGTFTISSDGVCKLVEDEDGNKILSIHKVAFLSGGKYIDVPRSQVAEGNQMGLVESGTLTVPKEYYEVGNSLVFPGIAGGTAKVWFDREISFATTSDTTKVLGLPSAYHPLVAYRTAISYDNIDDNRLAKAERKIARYEQELQQYEGNRRADEQTVMSVEVISGM